MFNLPEDFLHFMREVYGTEAANAWFQRLPSFWRNTPSVGNSRSCPRLRISRFTTWHQLSVRMARQ
ncbi:hypothetical protein KDH_00930 [Dictyobacter sp. S3.2.2.5]|uniref:Uncharacterized protein n=1 Tax=Dictyobacter halimunensis TaxID=3026934 RepID=A0ABQ6FGZ6_9CHLR|nr:hypothetical protein KDH_00930 [Dictyobacter sp. S3.2.2.5]